MAPGQKASAPLDRAPPIRIAVKTWACVFGLGLLATVFAALFLDRFVARHTHHLPFAAVANHAFSSRVLAGALIASLFALAVLLLVSDRVPRWSKDLGLSLAAALVSLYLGSKLKILFGWPHFTLLGHAVNNPVAAWSRSLFLGPFPSTHAATAAGTTLMLALCVPRRRVECFLALAAVNCLLVIGGWHRISDVIAGSLVGFTVAMAMFAIFEKLTTADR